MAETQFASNHPLTVKRWSKEVFDTALKQLMWVQRGMLSADGNRFVYVNKDLTKTVGDRITFPKVQHLTGTGQGDHGFFRGNEEALVTQSFNLEVHQRKHVASLGDELTAQRSIIDLRMHGKEELATWYTEKLESDIDGAIYGTGNESGIETVNSVTPSANRMFYIGQTSAGVIGTEQGDDATLAAQTQASYLFGTKVIDYAKRKAQIGTAEKVQPVRADGSDHYVMFIHPYQAKALQADDDWLNAQRNAGLRGKTNPIFTGALGVWNGVVVHEYERAPLRGNGEYFHDSGDLLATADRYIARAALLGKRAIALGWAMPAKYGEDYADYSKTKPVCTVNTIYGVKATQFLNTASSAQEDYGRVLIDTQVVPD